MLAGSPEASLSESWPHTHGCVHTNTPTQRPRPSVGWELHWTPRCGCARAVTVHGQSWGLTSPASGLEMMQSFTNSSFLMHGQNKRKIKKLYIHLKLSQIKKVLGFFFKLFLWRNKCVSHIQNAVIYFFRYPKGKSLEGAKWIQSLQPSQKTPCLSIPLGKRSCAPWKRNCLSDVENPQDTINYITSTLSLWPPLAAVWPQPQGCGQQPRTAGSDQPCSGWGSHAGEMPTVFQPTQSMGSFTACTGLAKPPGRVPRLLFCLFNMCGCSIVKAEAVPHFFLCSFFPDLNWFASQSSQIVEERLPSVTTGTWCLPSANELQV